MRSGENVSGKWSQCKHLCMTVSLCFLISGCATPTVQTLDGTVATYKALLSPQKAFAVGNLVDGGWVAGWTFGQSEVEKAKESALLSCEEKAARMGRPVRCRIMYENDTYIPQLTADPSADPAQRSPTTKTEPKKTIRTGSGVFISSDGMILTAEHVVREATNIDVVLTDGQQARAKLLYASQALDIAILSVGVRHHSYFPVRLNKPVPGEKVFTVGYPTLGLLGQEPKVSDGIVNSASGLRDDAGFMQISIPIQPGNSGGPVITESGSLVGVVSSTAAIEPFFKRTGTMPQNVSWAVHSSLAVTLLGREGDKVPSTTRERAIERAISASVLVVSSE